MWKLGLNRHGLAAQMQQSRVVSNQFVGGFSTWLLNRVSFVLVIAGFGANWSIANQLLRQQQVCINGVVVSDANYQVQPGDFITVQQALQQSQPEYSNFLTSNCLQVNWKLRAIVVSKTLSLNNSVAEVYLNQLQVNAKPTQKVGQLLDPFTSVLLRFETLFGQ